MEMHMKGENADCAGLRELIAWYPTGDLDRDDRRRIENHVATCTSCAELLELASDVKNQLSAETARSEVSTHGVGPHPDPELLVRFVEEADALDARRREQIEEHLRACEECAQEVDILETVERETAGIGQASAPALDRSTGETSPLRRFWNSLAATVLRPVPAAIYLTAAACVIVVLLVRPGMMPAPTMRPGEVEVVPGAGTLAGGVLLLPDDRNGVRGVPDTGGELPVLGAESAPLLLLELTGLEGPPRADDLYQIAIVPEGSAEPAWQTEVQGVVFAENYTLYLFLPPDTFGSGLYLVTVEDPENELIFRSRLEVR